MVFYLKSCCEQQSVTSFRCASLSPTSFRSSVAAVLALFIIATQNDLLLAMNWLLFTLAACVCVCVLVGTSKDSCAFRFCVQFSFLCMPSFRLLMPSPHLWYRPFSWRYLQEKRYRFSLRFYFNSITLAFDIFACRFVLENLCACARLYCRRSHHTSMIWLHVIFQATAHSFFFPFSSIWIDGLKTRRNEIFGSRKCLDISLLRFHLFDSGWNQRSFRANIARSRKKRKRNKMKAGNCHCICAFLKWTAIKAYSMQW